MRIGEISMNINTRACNYGSILHSWAFQYYLKKYEKIETVETINYVRKDLEKWNRKFPAIEWIRRGKPKRFIRQIIGYPAYRKRLKKVDRFISNNMSISERKYIQSDLSKGKLDYDILVADSDTIWAPRGDGSFDDGYFLNLPAMKGIKKISYAPSMGNAQLSDEQKEKVGPLLSDFSHISCRETYERELLISCINREVFKVLDPVLLVPRKDWESLIHNNYQGKKHRGYVLIYQPVDMSKALEECALNYSKNHDLELIKITIADVKKTRKGNQNVINDCSPEEFLYLANNAEAIFTNSFHMICFSVLFEKDFYAFSRKDDRKVVDICRIMGLENRFYKTTEEYKESFINYEEVKKNLMPQIQESKRWLHEAIYS